MSDTKWGYGNPENTKAFDTVSLNGREYELVHGEHPHSRSDNSIYLRDSRGGIEAFNGHRRCWRVEIEETNYLKESELSGDEVRKGGEVRLYCDGEQVFDQFVRSINSGIAVAQTMIPKLEEVANGKWLRKKDRDTLIGRKIFYERTPAVITSIIEDQGCIMIAPETGHRFEPPVYKEENEREYWLDEYGDRLKIEVFSDKIWWWRE